MIKTTAVVETNHGQSYMRRLCRHFSHKLDVNLEEHKAQIAFPFGECSITTTDTDMVFVVLVDEASEIDRAEDVVGRHLLRMAHKDEPVVEWNRS